MAVQPCMELIPILKKIIIITVIITVQTDQPKISFLNGCTTKNYVAFAFSLIYSEITCLIYIM